MRKKPRRGCFGKCEACDLGASISEDHAFWNYEYRLGRVVRSWNGMPIKRPEGVAAGVGPAVGARTGDDWVLFPALCEFLTEDKYEDGSSRQLPTLLTFYESGQWKGCLSDRDTDRVAFIVAEGPTALLVKWEEKLASSSVEWRGKQGKGQRGKR